jgi:hypothetical protein
MSVNFQRRNIGVLADIPTFEDVGRSSYVDYAAEGARQAPAAMRQEVAAADAADAAGAADAAPAPINPDDYEARARAALAQMEKVALQQKKAAGNPLNVAGSILGGVVGLPFSLLENAIGGGNNDLTAPFRPKQNAETRYQNSLAAIGERRAEFEKDLASVRSSNATALKTATGLGREEDQAGINQIGQLASSMLYMDDNAKAQRLPTLQSIATRYPNTKQYVEDIINNGFNPAVLAAYGSMSTDEGARQRSNEYLYGSKVVPTGDNTALVISGRPNVAPQVIDRSSPNAADRTITGLPLLTGSAPRPTTPVTTVEPTMQNTPRPELGPDGIPRYLTQAQYSVYSKELGKEKTDAWIKNYNIVVEQPQGQPAAPSRDAVDAELRKRGLIK